MSSFVPVLTLIFFSSLPQLFYCSCFSCQLLSGKQLYSRRTYTCSFSTIGRFGSSLINKLLIKCLNKWFIFSNPFNYSYFSNLIYLSIFPLNLTSRHFPVLGQEILLSLISFNLHSFGVRLTPFATIFVTRVYITY